MDDEGGIQLYPEEEEPVNLLNIKRGIISALLVPVSEEEEKSSTVVSHCKRGPAWQEIQRINTANSVSSSISVMNLLLLQATIHGQCLTEVAVTSRVDGVAKAVTLSRDLSHCDQFQAQEAPSSPLALLQRMVRCLKLA